uniref:Serine aminopeptidase S33 domain-containing protein n=2 Tax=Rhizophora mucronata TaxID=61149 RepID=A0A2P2KW83_RHIMU
MTPPNRLHRSVSQQKQKQRKVIVGNKHGEKLVGILHETGSKELVVVCHGFQSRKERIPMVALAVALEQEGISAFRFDFAGNGESEGLFQYGNYCREAEDLRSVVQHFCGEKRVITAVIGHSKGVFVIPFSVYVAEEDKIIK